MQKSMDIGISPIKPVPASMRRRSIAIFSLLILLGSGCRSHRQSVEMIALSRRLQQQEIQLNDTMWQSINLHLEGLSMELTVDSVGLITSITVPQVDIADLKIEKHIESEIKAMSYIKDTIVFNDKEKTENVSHISNNTIGNKIYNFICCILFLLIIILFIIRTLRKN